MAKPLVKYLVLSLPNYINSEKWLEEYFNGDRSGLINFNVPDFKIGTLDSLIQESEELSRWDKQLGTSVEKITEILDSVSDVSGTRKVDGKEVRNYIKSFQWNTSKYRLDKAVPELISIISGEAISTDNDLRTLHQNYQTTRTNFMAADSRRNGDLSVRLLHEIVKPEQFVLDSEYLVTVLVAVPKNLVSDFEKSYESLTEFVIPRSAQVIATDKEYRLYTVTLFKKYYQEFINRAREHKWQPRTDFTYSEEALNNMRKDFDLSKANEVKLRNDLIRLAMTAYSDVFASWVHIKSIRVYVESVLRYGLPPHFTCTLIKFEGPGLKNFAKTKKDIFAKFQYLGGDSQINSSSLHQYASLVDTEYEPFVFYELEIL